MAPRDQYIAQGPWSDARSGRFRIAVENYAGPAWEAASQALQISLPVLNLGRIALPGDTLGSASDHASVADTLPLEYLDSGQSISTWARLAAHPSRAIAAWDERPFVQLVIASCATVEEYRSRLKPLLRERIDAAARSGCDAETVVAFTPPLNQDPLQRVVRRIVDKLTDDFGTRKRHVVCRLDAAPAASAASAGQAVDATREALAAALPDLSEALSAALRQAVGSRLATLQADVRVLTLRRRSEGADVGALLQAKDNLGQMLQSTGLMREALREYIELEVLYTELTSPTRLARVDSDDEGGGSASEGAVFDLGGDKQGDDCAQLLDPAPFLHRYTATGAAKELAFRQYACARRVLLLRALGRDDDAWAGAVESVGQIAGRLMAAEAEGRVRPLLSDCWLATACLQVATLLPEGTRPAADEKSPAGARKGAVDADMIDLALTCAKFDPEGPAAAFYGLVVELRHMQGAKGAGRRGSAREPGGDRDGADVAQMQQRWLSKAELLVSARAAIVRFCTAVGNVASRELPLAAASPIVPEPPPGVFGRPTHRKRRSSSVVALPTAVVGGDAGGRGAGKVDAGSGRGKLARQASMVHRPLGISKDLLRDQAASWVSASVLRPCLETRTYALRLMLALSSSAACFYALAGRQRLAAGLQTDCAAILALLATSGGGVGDVDVEAAVAAVRHLDAAAGVAARCGWQMVGLGAARTVGQALEGSGLLHKLGGECLVVWCRGLLRCIPLAAWSLVGGRRNGSDGVSASDKAMLLRGVQALASTSLDNVPRGGPCLDLTGPLLVGAAPGSFSRVFSARGQPMPAAGGAAAACVGHLARVVVVAHWGLPGELALSRVRLYLTECFRSQSDDSPDAGQELELSLSRVRSRSKAGGAPGDDDWRACEGAELRLQQGVSELEFVGPARFAGTFTLGGVFGVLPHSRCSVAAAASRAPQAAGQMVSNDAAQVWGPVPVLPGDGAAGADEKSPPGGVMVVLRVAHSQPSLLTSVVTGPAGLIAGADQVIGVAVAPAGRTPGASRLCRAQLRLPHEAPVTSASGLWHSASSRAGHLTVDAAAGSGAAQAHGTDLATGSNVHVTIGKGGDVRQDGDAEGAVVFWVRVRAPAFPRRAPRKVEVSAPGVLDDAALQHGGSIRARFLGGSQVADTQPPTPVARARSSVRGTRVSGRLTHAAPTLRPTTHGGAPLAAAPPGTAVLPVSVRHDANGVAQGLMAALEVPVSDPFDVQVKAIAPGAHPGRLAALVTVRLQSLALWDVAVSRIALRCPPGVEAVETVGLSSEDPPLVLAHGGTLCACYEVRPVDGQANGAVAGARGDGTWACTLAVTHACAVESGIAEAAHGDDAVASSEPAARGFTFHGARPVDGDLAPRVAALVSRQLRGGVLQDAGASAARAAGSSFEYAFDLRYNVADLGAPGVTGTDGRPSGQGRLPKLLVSLLSAAERGRKGEPYTFAWTIEVLEDAPGDAPRGDAGGDSQHKLHCTVTPVRGAAWAPAVAQAVEVAVGSRAGSVAVVQAALRPTERGSLAPPRLAIAHARVLYDTASAVEVD
ncbi:unnamed protein product [Pedinophyceae sp. YPF-701]|nr:unnamed protein product [Pedinophyceae sp. YPF-701]